MSSKVTYRQQFTRCGKQRCQTCRQGAGHGPYWYAYWSVNGRTVSKYLGKDAPEGIHIEIATREPGQARVQVDDRGKPASHNAPQHNVQNETVIEAPAPARTFTGLSTNVTSGKQPVLRIYLLGQFRIEKRIGKDWAALVSPLWQRRRARTLLGCLLSYAGRRMTREESMKALWPDLDMETAANRLNGAVHEVRRILEPGLARSTDSKMLRLERGVLQLAGADLIWVDADIFEELLNNAPPEADLVQVEQLLEEAARIYRGDYLLEELYAEWANARREALRHSWIELLLKLAELRSSRGAFVSAIEPLERLLATDSTQEAAVRLLMLLLTRLDRRGEALQAYHRLVNTLQQEYESDPFPETVELYKALRQGDLEVSNLEAPVTAINQSTQIASPMQHQLNALPDSDIQPTRRAFPSPVLHLERQNRSPLVGRDHELMLMREHLLAGEETQMETSGEGVPFDKQKAGDQHKRQKQLQFLLLMGEAGIGKTRIAEEFSLEAHAQGWSVAWGHACEHERATPYRPWIEALHTMLPEADLAHLFSSGKPDSVCQIPPAQERLRLWEATLTLLSAMSRETRILLVLDDLHWADERSLELLAYLVRHLQDEPILLVGTCRDEELIANTHLCTLINDLRREQRITTLSLQPLTSLHIGSLVAHLPEDLVQSIQILAAGNPLFAEELARFSETSRSSHKGSTGEIGSALQVHISREGVLAGINSDAMFSKTILSMLERRLSKLSKDCLVLLGQASVLGDSFELNQLLLIEGERGPKEDYTLDLLEEALHAGFLTEERTGAGITYRFRAPFYLHSWK